MSTTRRLTAILAADVVGYSRRGELDDEGTLAALRRSGYLTTSQKIPATAMKPSVNTTVRM